MMNPIDKINPIYISYAKKMSVLGDKVLDITKYFPDVKKCTTVEELKAKYNMYLKKTSEFKKFKLEYMLKMHPGTYPLIIKKEHEESVEELQKFIDGTDTMSNAIDISQCFLDKDNLVKGIIFDKDMFIKGSLEQQKAAERFAQLMEQICKKFGI